MLGSKMLTPLPQCAETTESVRQVISVTNAVVFWFTSTNMDVFVNMGFHCFATLCVSHGKFLSIVIILYSLGLLPLYHSP